MKQLVITSRCPITHDRVEGKDVVRENAGGVATALRRALKEEGGTWICWGDGKYDADYPEEDFEGYRIVRVTLTPKEKKGFYDNYSNGTLWPLFHYFRTRIKFTPESYDQYRNVNRKFRDRVLEFADAESNIWIHDYQLALLPGMLRDSRLENHITFTWHIPWVSEDFYSILPESREIIGSLCRSDLVTFHTKLHRKHFVNSARRLLGHVAAAKPKVVSIPLGIDRDYYSSEKTRPLGIPDIGKRKLIFSIDRLDYTKGLTNRVMAIDALIRKHRDLKDKFVYLMVVNPSRTSVQEYREMKKELEMNVGRIDGKYSTLAWRPIIYMYRKITDNLLKSLYRRADIAFIAPLIDGLNLVSKEFVAVNDHGVMIISRFAGASAELNGALKVNPYDINGMADALYTALNMKEEEIQGRLSQLKHVVEYHNLDWWIRSVMKAARTGTGK